MCIIATTSHCSFNSLFFLGVALVTRHNLALFYSLTNLPHIASKMRKYLIDDTWESNVVLKV
jgi:hypothetical protein